MNNQLYRFLHLRLRKFVTQLLRRSEIDHANGKHFCSVCKREVNRFLRISDGYLSELDNNQYIYSIFTLETLNILQYTCPLCGANDRNRLYALYFDNIFNHIDRTNRYKFIDFAPDNSLAKFIRNHLFLDYRSADLFMELVDDRVDLTDMKIYGNASVDMFICSHVLEHIEDDKKAMQELYRILKPGGFGIVMAPIHLDLKDIYENPAITDEAARWKHFGQGDHIRVYSKQGFVTRLQGAGFDVHQYGVKYFGEDVFEKHGIHRRSVLYIAKKTSI